MDSIVDVPGISVGEYSDYSAGTGCSVILFDSSVKGALDLRGGGTSTRQVDSLLQSGTYGRINAILLTGGSGYGLNASEGVVRYLEEKKTGLDVGYGFVVPSVPTAVIFDLGIGDGNVRPDAEMSYNACLGASGKTVGQGCIGVGTGATIGKILGLKNATKGGVGSASFLFEKSNVYVGVYVVVNSWGDVLSFEDGRIIAGARDVENGVGFMDTVKLIKQGYESRTPASGNTTLAVVATNALLSKSELFRVATIAQTGISRVISPAHTVSDGDLVFSVSTGSERGNANSIGVVAAQLISLSANRAVMYAKTLLGIPSAGDVGK